MASMASMALQASPLTTPPGPAAAEPPRLPPPRRPAAVRPMRPAPLALALAALLAAALPLAPPAPAIAQPVVAPGHVAGLDLSTPEAGAQTLVTLWAGRDFVGVWLALDSELQFRLAQSVVRLDFTTLLGPEPMPGLHRELFQRAARVLPAWADDAGQLRARDVFPYVAAMLRAAAMARVLPFDLSAEAGLAAPPPEPGAPPGSRRLVLGSGAEALVLVMVRRGGLWRLAHLERESPELPAAWRAPGG